jgi:hypothetical protein
MRLLSKWRFAQIGSPWFTDPDVFKHYEATMQRQREEDPAEHVRASKAIGWENIRDNQIQEDKITYRYVAGLVMLFI